MLRTLPGNKIKRKKKGRNARKRKTLKCLLEINLTSCIWDFCLVYLRRRLWYYFPKSDNKLIVSFTFIVHVKIIKLFDYAEIITLFNKFILLLAVSKNSTTFADSPVVYLSILYTPPGIILSFIVELVNLSHERRSSLSLSVSVSYVSFRMLVNWRGLCHTSGTQFSIIHEPSSSQGIF